MEAVEIGFLAPGHQADHVGGEMAADASGSGDAIGSFEIAVGVDFLDFGPFGDAHDEQVRRAALGEQAEVARAGLSLRRDGHLDFGLRRRSRRRPNRSGPGFHTGSGWRRREIFRGCSNSTVPPGWGAHREGGGKRGLADRDDGGFGGRFSGGLLLLTHTGRRRARAARPA